MLVVTAGLYLNQRLWRPRQAAARIPGDGPGVWDLTTPLATLAALLLVFVLVQTYGSWAAAGRGETDEATATLGATGADADRGPVAARSCPLCMESRNPVARSGAP